QPPTLGPPPLLPPAGAAPGGPPPPRKAGPNPVLWIGAAVVLVLVMVGTALLIKNHRGSSTGTPIEALPSSSTTLPRTVASGGSRATSGSTTPVTAAMSGPKRAMFAWVTDRGYQLDNELTASFDKFLSTDLATVKAGCEAISRAVTDARAYRPIPDPVGNGAWSAALDLFAQAVPHCRAASARDSQLLAAITTVEKGTEKYRAAWSVIGATLKGA
ncbi:MAG: hypothetical protein JWN46_1584, partial [Acidimicrobiales bacterium]|nr:hypothetical protein [Acidimicrobiales bacterium]